MSERNAKTASVCTHISTGVCEANSKLKTAVSSFEHNSQQPTANSQQPTANSQQPTANSQQPTANSQQPIIHITVKTVSTI
jgi:hypothetical protein